MSYTTERQPEGRVRCYENIIRQMMIAELVAIDDYSTILSQSDIKELNYVLEHILEEENKHYGLFLQLLRRIDREEWEFYIKVLKKDEGKNLRQVKVEYGNNKKDRRLLLEEIRKNIKGELEAIVLYEDLIEEIPDREGRCIVQEVIKEEKEHTEELTAVLLKLDKDCYGPLKG